MKKIVVLTSGGDAPGMNAALRAAVRMAISKGLTVYASFRGFQGLVEQKLSKLDTTSVANIIQTGGTILKTDRCKAFYDPEVRKKCIHFLKEQGIDGLIVIGGDGSFRGATLLNKEGGPAVIGIPATIDNDIVGTDYTLGYDTARNTAISAIDKIRDTASSHNRHFIVEVMGKNSGFLAIDVGIAGGAEFILIPEVPFTTEEVATKIIESKRQKLSSIIVAAEKDKPGHSFDVASELNKITNRNYRVCILGHTQRGGSPSVLDRKVASLMGAKAAELLTDNETNKMVSIIDDKLTFTEFPNPSDSARKFYDKSLLDLNGVICQ